MGRRLRVLRGVCGLEDAEEFETVDRESSAARAVGRDLGEVLG